MKKRTHYLIDKKFQLKYTFSIIGLKFIIIALIAGAIAFNAAYNNDQLNRNNSQLHSIINDQSNVMTIQDNIVEALLTYSQAVKDKSQKKAINDVAMNHSKNNKTIANNINIMREVINHNDNITRYNMVLLIGVCLIIILQGLVLYFLLIRQTHRISGPIYVMSNYIRQIIHGQIPDSVRNLRKNDELQEFYELFSQMVKTLKKNQE